ncbi:putative phage abortive infection protein [Paenibacillus sp. FSL R5-0345]|uniref:putative phage abortive infection protein n=1 Tax=Paenibacillus sp. FSL R5-0345 TaxID=1536770 RepID=UPI000693E9D2|nr:putative phage abortive infection protein [Paenibacillus sp. FSL R5-0345]
MGKGKQENKKKWSQKKENWWITVGFIIAVGAIGIPFVLMRLFQKKFVLINFNELGVVGDFFGGTTVGLLSLASIIFVTAAIIMQKEELELQRNEVQKTREEYEITNATMKKQQFDSTFFNMINLHHDITKDIVIEDTKGRAVMEKILEKLRYAYNNNVYKPYTARLKQQAIEGNKELLDDLVRNEFFDFYFNDFIGKNEPEVQFGFRENDIDTSGYDNFHETLKKGTNKKWNDLKVQLNENYEKEVYNNDDSYLTWLNNLSFNGAKSYSSAYTDKFKQEFIDEPLNELKVAAFEMIYNEYESQIGHYFRNLYRIVKLIQDEKFHENELENNKEKRKYRGILRAQLSSYELLVLFYNLVYSSKGKGFKELLTNTNFFDDHLSSKDFIWANDNFELEQMASR